MLYFIYFISLCEIQPVLFFKKRKNKTKKKHIFSIIGCAVIQSFFQHICLHTYTD